MASSLSPRFNAAAALECGDGERRRKENNDENERPRQYKDLWMRVKNSCANPQENRKREQLPRLLRVDSHRYLMWLKFAGLFRLGAEHRRPKPGYSASGWRITSFLTRERCQRSKGDAATSRVEQSVLSPGEGKCDDGKINCHDSTDGTVKCKIQRDYISQNCGTVAVKITKTREIPIAMPMFSVSRDMAVCMLLKTIGLEISYKKRP